jgi:hypothetical protein
LGAFSRNRLREGAAEGDRPMSKRTREKGRLAPFVPYLKETMQHTTWRVMSLGARMLYLHLKARYNQNSQNNGKIYLPTRIAAKELGSGLSQIGRWFRELQHYGFIVMMEGGYLGVEGKGRAPRWRLTELGYMNNPPTRDYTRWLGNLFVIQKAGSQAGKSKKMSRSRKLDQGDPGSGITSDPESGITFVPDRSRKLNQGNVLSDPESGIKSSLTIGVARVGSKQEDAEAMSVLTALLEWKTPKLQEIAYTEELRKLYRCAMFGEAEPNPSEPTADTKMAEEKRTAPRYSKASSSSTVH